MARPFTFFVLVTWCGIAAPETQLMAEGYRTDFQNAEDLQEWKLDPAYFHHYQWRNHRWLCSGPSDQPEEVPFALQHAEGPGKYRNFFLEVSLRREHWNRGQAGLFFRNGERQITHVFFNDRYELVVRQNWKEILKIVPRAPFPRQKEFLQVVAADEHVCIYHNGDKVFETDRAPNVQGAWGVMSNMPGDCFYRAAVDSAIPPDMAVEVEYRPAGGLLWLPPGRAASIPVYFKNRTDTSGRVDFIGTLTSRGGKASFAIRATFAVRPRDTTAVELLIPALPEDFYHLRYTLNSGRHETLPRAMPLLATTAAKQGGAPNRDTFFPRIVYSKPPNFFDPLAEDTYLAAMCWDLRQHGINGVLHPFTRGSQLEVVARFGMVAGVRTETAAANPREWQHPAVHCLILGDETSLEQVPEYKQRRESLRAAFPDTPVVTCMVGDVIGTGHKSDPLPIWALLDTSPLMFRLYLFKHQNHGLLSPKEGHVAAPEAFRRASQPGKRIWFCAPTFGRNPSPDAPPPFYRNPTAAELNSLLHLALAHGTKGFFFYTYQAETAQDVALVDPQSLLPCDDKYDVVKKFSDFLDQDPRSFLSMRRADWGAVSDNARVEAVGEMLGGRHAVYVVNLDARQGQSAAITLPGEFAQAADFQTKSVLPTDAVGGRRVLKLTLAPGAGRLLLLSNSKTSK